MNSVESWNYTSADCETNCGGYVSFKRIITVMAIFGALFLLTGCSQHVTAEYPVISAKADQATYEGKLIDFSLNKGKIMEPELFAQELREANRSIYSKNLIAPKEMAYFYKVKNITPDTEVCFGDMDCDSRLRCVTECHFISGPLEGSIKACSYDDFKEYDFVEFRVPYGFCINWLKDKVSLTKHEQ